MNFINKNRLAKALLIILILVPMLAIGYLLLFDQPNKQRQEMINKNMQIANLTANYVDDYLSCYKETLKGVASQVPLINNDRNTLIKLLSNISFAHAEASLFYVADTKGRLLAKYPDNNADKNIADQDFFLTAMQGKVFIGGPYVGRVTDLDIICITVPFYQDGKVSGIVGVSIPLTELQNKLSVIQIGRSGYATLFTKDGKFLSIGPSPGEEPPEQHSFVTLQEAPWIVVIAQPLQEFNTQISQIIWRNICIIVLLVLFVIVILRYLTLLKDRIAAEKLQKAEKLALVGQLAAGVAHEIRNPLTSIKGFVQLIQSKKNDSIPEFYLDIITQELDRIDDIVSEMVVLAKPVPIKFTEVNLRELITNILTLMRPQALLKNIEMELIASEEHFTMQGDSNQLKQVFINLIKNSIEAIVDGGFIKIHLTNRGNSVEVQFQDNGPGIPCENLEKLGTPFFTTKETGTGLGLMVTYGIIQNHKGEFTLKSEVGQGTTFTINFPV